MDRSPRAMFAKRPEAFPAARLEFGIEPKFAASPALDTSRAVFVPQHYESNYAYPLIVWLHGADADEWQLMGMIQHLSLRNFLVVAPRGLCLGHGGWGWPEDPPHVDEAEDRIFAAIEVAQKKYHIHPERVFLAGADCGGTLALRTAMSFPERFAGVASLGGALPESRQTPLSRWSQVRNLPVFLGVGGASDAYSPERAREDLRLLLVAGLWSISLREYHPCTHPLVPHALADLNRWFMEHLDAAVISSPNPDQPSWCAPE